MAPDCPECGKSFDSALGLSIHYGQSHKENDMEGSALSEDEVVGMRQKYADDASQGELADEYGISQSRVSRIVRGVEWPDAGGPTK